MKTKSLFKSATSDAAAAAEAPTKHKLELSTTPIENDPSQSSLPLSSQVSMDLDNDNDNDNDNDDEYDHNLFHDNNNNSKSQSNSHSHSHSQEYTQPAEFTQQMNSQVDEQTQLGGGILLSSGFTSGTPSSTTKKDKDKDRGKNKRKNNTNMMPPPPRPPQPWGRLVPNLAGRGQIDLLPQPPAAPNPNLTANAANAQQNSNIRPPSKTTTFNDAFYLSKGDVFNEYTLGRSPKNHIVISKPQSEGSNSNGNGNGNGNNNSQESHSQSQSQSLSQDNENYLDVDKEGKWVHTMLSNRHCKIYCLVEGGVGDASTASASASSEDSENREVPLPPLSRLDVYIEDTSANGTIVNGGIRLRRGERRLLNTGDEISLVSINGLTRLPNLNMREEMIKHFSFTFINIFQQKVVRHSHGGGIPPTITGGNSNSNIGGNSNSNSNSNSRAIGNNRNHNHNHNHNQKPQASPHRPGVGSNLNFFQPNNSNSNSNSSAANTRPQRQLQAKPPAPPSTATTFSRRIEEWYDIRECIGTGTCGEVRRCINRQTGFQWAVKIIGLKRFDNPMTRAPGLSVEDLKQEAEMLRSLNHPYIVKLEDVFTSSHAIYLVMELVSGGDLFDRIISKGCYGEVLARRCMRRVLNAVSYLHGKQIVHRDLKPENILLDNHDSDVAIKITDFGLAKRTNKDGLRTFCGTPQYFAPEVLKRRNTVQGTGRYGMAADMWSLGVILYILLSGAPPFDASESIDSVSNAQIEFKGANWDNISDKAKNLVSKLLTASPTARFTVQQAILHEWIHIEDGDTHTNPLLDPLLSAISNNNNGGGGNNNNNNNKLYSNSKPKPKAKPKSPQGPQSIVELEKKPKFAKTTKSSNNAKKKNAAGKKGNNNKNGSSGGLSCKSPGSRKIEAEQSKGLSEDEIVEDDSSEEDEIVDGEGEGVGEGVGEENKNNSQQTATTTATLGSSSSSNKSNNSGGSSGSGSGSGGSAKSAPLEKGQMKLPFAKISKQNNNSNRSKSNTNNSNKRKQGGGAGAGGGGGASGGSNDPINNKIQRTLDGKKAVVEPIQLVMDEENESMNEEKGEGAGADVAENAGVVVVKGKQDIRSWFMPKK